MRADNAIVVLIVDKFVGSEHSLFSPRALVGHGRIAPIIDYLFADPHVLVRCIQDQGFNFGEPLHRSAIEGIKSNAVVDVSGSNSNVQHKAPSVTGNVSRVRKSTLVFTLMEHPTIRIRCGLRNSDLLILLLELQRFLTIGYAILVDLLAQLLIVDSSGSFGDRSRHSC